MKNVFLKGCLVCFLLLFFIRNIFSQDIPTDVQYTINLNSSRNLVVISDIRQGNNDDIFFPFVEASLVGERNGEEVVFAMQRFSRIVLSDGKVSLNLRSLYEDVGIKLEYVNMLVLSVISEEGSSPRAA